MKNLRISARRLAAALAAALTVRFAPPVRAAVVTDGSVGPKTSLAGRVILLPASLGVQKGGNLFHSFTAFGVDRGQTVTFTGPTTVKNVLARVTGGQPSQINGTLGCSIPNANLFLINPAGISFGSRSALNVNGTFTATTADAVRLDDGRSFSAVPAAGGVLSGGSPVAFGFASAKPGAISIKSTRLSAPAARLVGGSVAVVGALVDTPAGHLSAAAVRSGTVAIDPVTDDLIPVASTVGGPMTIRLGALQTNGRGAGRLDVFANDLVVQGEGGLLSVTTGSAAGRGLVVRVPGTMRVGQAQIDSGSDAGGNAGPLTLTAGTLSLTAGADVGAPTTGGGNGGSVRVRVGRLWIDNGDAHSTDLTGIQAEADEGSTGAAGEVAVTADTLSILHGGTISSTTSGSGPAGTVTIKAGSLSVRSSGTILSLTTASGDAGRVSIDAGSARIDGASSASGYPTGVSSQATPGSTGAAGSVELRAGTLAIVGGGEIASDAGGRGTGGSVSVRAGRVVVDGASAPGGMSTGISSGSSEPDSGAAGDLTVVADTLMLGNNGQISSDSFGTGPAGTIGVRARELTMTNGGVISSEAFDAGNAGSVTVHAGRAILETGDAPTWGSRISSSSAGGGAAGTVRVTADRLTIDGQGNGAYASGIVSTADEFGTGATGAGGDIEIIARHFDLLNGGSVVADGAAGHAGAIRVRAGSLLVNGGTGMGGNTLISSDAYGAGAGGGVAIRAHRVVIDGNDAHAFTGISSESDAAQIGATGPAGDVTVAADTLDLVGGGVITSDTNGPAPAGRVSVRADAMTVAGLAALGIGGGVFSDAAAGSTGPAGEVVISAGSLSIRDGADVGSNTEAAGDAGRTVVKADTLRIDATGAAHALTGISSAAVQGSTGAAGDVSVAATDTTVTAGGVISSQSLGGGRGGTVRIDGDRLTLGPGATVAASSTKAAAGDVVVRMTDTIRGNGGTAGSRIAVNSQAGDGGNVTLNAGRLIALSHTDVTARAAANGGRLTLDPLLVTLNHSILDGRANGQPVRVTIDPAAALLISPDTQILADNPVLPPDVDLSGALARLVTPTLGGTAVVAQGCEEQLKKNRFSSFTARERLGAPPAAGDAVASPPESP